MYWNLNTRNEFIGLGLISSVNLLLRNQIFFWNKMLKNADQAFLSPQGKMCNVSKYVGVKYRCKFLFFNISRFLAFFVTWLNKIEFLKRFWANKRQQNFTHPSISKALHTMTSLVDRALGGAGDVLYITCHYISMPIFKKKSLLIYLGESSKFVL